MDDRDGDDRVLLLFEVDGVLVTRTPAGEPTRTAGSWELLSQLQREGTAVTSLVTDQSEDDIRALLGDVGAGLARYLDLEIGAYRGDGAGAAPGGEGLARVAAARGRAAARHPGGLRAVVVARGEADAVAALRTGTDDLVAVCGTGRGGTTAADLRAAGASHVIEGLAELLPALRGRADGRRT